MALIKCPECGQEISDKAARCIHCGIDLKSTQIQTKICAECGKENSVDATECIYCGCPFEEKEESPIVEVREPISVQKVFVEQPKDNKKKIVFPVIALFAVLLIGFCIYNAKVIKPKNTYNEAMELLEKGKYEEADKLLDTIKNYNDVETVQEQLKYESYAYSAINSLKQYLKNPDSYQPYEIVFYASMGTEEDSKNESESEDEKYPACVMHYGAQNGFGGNTTSYALCTYSDDDGKYDVLGTCDSLDEDDYDMTDEDDIYDLLICKIINEYRKGGDTIGDIDLSRLKTVLKNDAYSTIKIID